ncbi:FAD-dependent oxidoreductase [Caballeronia sp. AZ1_KS37]|uniref:FAD-dependent oxidoreductase n=1 Tax=Caballeronia sp. AZ1_KS37 TaxID=2921756 RepID=UPI002028394B|nr:FAD-dependent oxidoreductase [Caballeronia sp. AZ1_KS37]
MPTSVKVYDAVVIGGGFYGVVIAQYLVRQRGFKRVCLLEREAALMQRASYNNQARVHNGYHYPRSFTTAFRSRINLPRFVHDWPDAVVTNFVKLYAIARRNSKVTARQFERFCRETSAQLEPADASHRALFEPRLIEEVFVVREYAFDSRKLAAWAAQELSNEAIEVRLNTRAEEIVRSANNALRVTTRSSGDALALLTTRYVFNCTYSGLNQFGGDFPGTRTQLKQEITEMALLKVPPELEKVGITVMDGPFFSMMPFPSRGLHTLSHVRYTPHLYWSDERGIDPYARLAAYHRETRVDRMIRDVGRYMPAVFGAKYVESLFEIKTVLTKNDTDDGRPIFFERHVDLPGCFSVLGGKIDNIYDVLEKLDSEPLVAFTDLTLSNQSR